MNTKITSLIFFAIIFAYTIFSAYKISITFAPDFSIFYHAAADILHHVSPYADKTLFTAFNYPMISAVLFIPLTIFPYQIAQTIFTLLNVITVFSIVFFCFYLLKKRISLPVFLFTVSLIFLSFPAKFTMGMGQTNHLAYFFLLLGFIFLGKNKIFWTICFLALAVFFKPILGLSFLVLLFEKKWSFVLLLSFTILLLAIGFPILFQEPSANGIFLQNILSQNVGGREVYYNQGLLGFIARTTNSLSLRSALNFFFTIQLIFFVCWKMFKKTLVEKLSFILTLLVIIDPLSWQHHFVFLILPFLTVFFSIQKRKKGKLLLFTLFSIAYTLVSWNIKTPLQFEHFPLSLLLSNQFYGALLLFILEFLIF